MPLSWTDVTIFDGEYLSEAKLDAMQGNADFLRDELSVLHVGSAPAETGMEFNVGAHEVEGSASGVVSAVRIRLDVSAQTAYSTDLRFFQPISGIDTWRPFHLLNVPWTSPAAGSAADIVLTLEIERDWADPTPGWEDVGEIARIPGALRRADFNYLSVWVELVTLAHHRRGGFVTDLNWCWIRMRHLTVLGSRGNEGFA